MRKAEPTKCSRFLNLVFAFSLGSFLNDYLPFLNICDEVPFFNATKLEHILLHSTCDGLMNILIDFACCMHCIEVAGLPLSFTFFRLRCQRLYARKSLFSVHNTETVDRHGLRSGVTTGAHRI